MEIAVAFKDIMDKQGYIPRDRIIDFGPTKSIPFGRTQATQGLGQ